MTLERISRVHHKLRGVTYRSGFVDLLTLESPPTMFQSSRSHRSRDREAEVYVQSHLLSSAVNCHEMDRWR